MEKHSKSVSHHQNNGRGDRELFNRSTVIQSNEFPNEFGMGFGSRAQSPDILQAKSSNSNKPQSLMPKIQNEPINNAKKGRRNITMT